MSVVIKASVIINTIRYNPSPTVLEHLGSDQTAVSPHLDVIFRAEVYRDADGASP